MSRQQRLTLVATILGSTVVFLDATIVNVALPSIGRELNAGLAGQQWVVEAYMLTMVSLLLVGGSLGDQFGRRRLFVIGLVAFGATSILCALAPSEEFLVGARALQGIAGALLVPGSLAIVASTFAGEERGKAVGTWTAWTGIATVFGPAGGGALVGLISWRAIFWVNIPLIAVTVTLALRAIEESSDPGADYVTDVLPAVLVFGLGLSATVAPLTATVLDSVSERRVGIASGVNNGVSRVAGLLAIAVLGAVISAHFGARLDAELASPTTVGGSGPKSFGAPGTPAGEAIAEAKEQPLGVPDTEEVPPAQARAIVAASTEASTSAFHLGALIAGILMILGGIASAIGIENPRRAADAAKKLDLVADG